MKVADLFAALGLEVDKAAFAAADAAIASVASAAQVATAQVEHFSQVVLATMRAGQAPVNDAVVSWEGLNKTTARAPINLKNIAIGLTAVGFAVHQVTGFFGSVIEEFDKLDETSQRTGVAVEELQALGYAAGFSGIEMDSLAGSLGKFQKGAAAADKGSKSMRAAFTAAGVDAKKLIDGTTTTEQALAQVAETFAGMEDGAEKAALAQQLFGRSGTELIPFLNAGRDGIERLTKEARSLGLVVGGDDVKSFAELDDQLTTMKAQWKAIKVQITRALLPVFRAIIDVLGAMAKHFDAVVVAVLSLAAAFLILKAGSIAAAWASLRAWVAAMAPLILMALGIAAIILLVEDLYRWFKGGDSVMRNLYESALKWLTWDKIWEGIKAGFGAVLAGFEAAGKAVRDFLGITNDTFIIGGGGGQAGIDDMNNKMAQIRGRTEYGRTGGLIGPAVPRDLATSSATTAAPVTNNNSMQANITVHAPPGAIAEDVANLTRTALGGWWDEKARELAAQTGGGL